MRLKDKVCIITGATSGIGRRTAEIFAEEGALVVISGRRAELGEAVARAIGPRCAFVVADATDEAQTKALIDFTVGKHGRIDCLFNNAGGPAPMGGIETTELEAYERAFAQNVRSVMLGMKHVAPVMMAQQSGSIINNGSRAASRVGRSPSMVYAAAKAAVVQLSAAVAIQLGEHFVRVNTISPGGIATGFAAKSVGVEADRADGVAERMKEGLAKRQAIPRAGTPEDVARAAVFLASDESSFVNGIDLIVDGGVVGGNFWSVARDSYGNLKERLGVD
ncbi:MAG: SDR family NAD(P)-dependent oxidoreductase [Reyranellaceae bacterium]